MGRNVEVPTPLKLTLTDRAEQLIRDKFKPWLPMKAEAAKEHGFNYVVDVYTTWRGRYFYFCAKYRNPRENAEEENFEVRTTRLEYVGGQRFNLAYMRHTGKWCDVYSALSLEECLEAIEENELFWPVD
ncbi:hypothetical protein GWO43_30645 [candidate division KSB1 bacterium]|nr:hypothetical protein [candidate division KSB1 bacterium]NIR72983.1 hypothetical protein [candidate division KSB1 bacterium]NIS28269.1 hypothetical protein [candidate division KSB1 bacterium]NIT75141.1 hypothetical protein [candidate division KSB1 bacterium]NIU28948.1 hypothetical protein [candidate division KSB1 bacterium]